MLWDTGRSYQNIQNQQNRSQRLFTLPPGGEPLQRLTCLTRSYHTNKNTSSPTLKIPDRLKKATAGVYPKLTVSPSSSRKHRRNVRLQTVGIFKSALGLHVLSKYYQNCI